MVFPVPFTGEGTEILLKGERDGDMEGEIQNKEKIRASIGCSVLRKDSISEDVTNMFKCLPCSMLLWGHNHLTLMAEVGVFKTRSRHSWCPKEPPLMHSLNYKWGLLSSTYTIIFMIIPKSSFVSLTLSVVNDLSRNDKASHRQEGVGKQVWHPGTSLSRQFKEEEELVRTQGMVAHAFNPNALKAEAGGSLSLSPAWSTEQLQICQCYMEKPCLEIKKQNK